MPRCWPAPLVSFVLGKRPGPTHSDRSPVPAVLAQAVGSFLGRWLIEERRLKGGQQQPADIVEQSGREFFAVEVQSQSLGQLSADDGRQAAVVAQCIPQALREKDN